ncbi:hypothetical protein [Saccharicrinis sp. 156]|uniref:hypothetical protein n=1 Tax=Saccharicrinis sp. 156 TaxID=3417574 RepID=UPI003D344F9D
MKKQQLNLFGEVVEPTINDSIIIKTKNTRSKTLSKEQKQFNRLVKKIEKLTDDIEKKEQILENTLAKYHTTINPVKIEIAQSLIEFAKNTHQLLQKFKYTNAQQRDLSGMIVSLLDSAFVEIEPDEEVRKLYDQYSFEGTYDEAVEEDMASQLEDLVEILEFQFGIELDRDSIPDPMTASQEDIAAFVASLHQKIDAEQSTANTREPSGQEKKRKTSKAQHENELKEKAAMELKNKSLRSLYLSLAKALHPDTGGTEDEIIQKEELMKQVTQAYDDKDLSSLLKLEVTWLKGEAGHTGNLADKQLNVYNQVLREQVKELEQKQFSMSVNPRFFEIEDYCFAQTKDIPAMLDEELEELNVRLVELQNDMLKIKNKKTLLDFLKTIKESAMQSTSINLLDNLFDDEEMEDFFF